MGLLVKMRGSTINTTHSSTRASDGGAIDIHGSHYIYSATVIVPDSSW